MLTLLASQFRMYSYPDLGYANIGSEYSFSFNVSKADLEDSSQMIFTFKFQHRCCYVAETLDILPVI